MHKKLPYLLHTISDRVTKIHSMIYLITVGNIVRYEIKKPVIDKWWKFLDTFVQEKGTERFWSKQVPLKIYIYKNI